VFRKLGNVVAAVRRHGLFRYLNRLATNVWRYLIYKRHRSTVFRRDLAGPVELIQAKVPLDVVPYTGEHRTELYEFLAQFQPPEHIDGCFRSGWMPMLGYYQGRLVGLSWLSLSPIYLDSVELTLDYGERSGYIEYTRTDSAMKGLGIAPAIRSWICHYLREAGCKQAFVSVGNDNLASQAVAKKCGFAAYESIVLTRILGIRRHERQRIGSA
jgi:GNAT superfamily N-acetyltransferase